MIVLNKKRILLITGSIFVALLVFTFTTMNKMTSEEYISTVSLPVSGKVIVIDAGHGVPDEGVHLLH